MGSCTNEIITSFLDLNMRSKMKWILFIVFVALFIIIASLTIMAVFTEVIAVPEEMEGTLFKIYIGEVGAAVLALFYMVFDLRPSSRQKSDKVRLRVGKFEDITKFIGKEAVCKPYLEDGTPMEEIKSPILDDEGLAMRLNLPESALSVIISAVVDSKTYTGSFVVDTHQVEFKGA